MKIDSYSFGSIIVNGKTYQKDIIVFPESVRPDWLRESRHSLTLNDLKEIIDYRPDILIVGRGAYSGMTIPDSTKDELTINQIQLIEADTKKACAIFNLHMKNKIKTVGAFHLTC